MIQLNTNNRLYLNKYFPGVIKTIDNYDYQSFRVELINARNTKKTLKIKTNEKELYVHSSYNPEREAQQLLKKELNTNIDRDTHIVFFGLGLGYHVTEFVKTHKHNSYTVIEPSIEIFNIVADAIIFEDTFNENITHLYVGNVNSDKQIINTIYKDSATKIEIVVLPAYKLLFSKLLSQFIVDSKNKIREKRSELATNYNFQFNWIENSILNHKHVLKTPNILDDSFKEMFKDKPVMIVSAGPSLSDDIESIRMIKKNNLAYIFSVGSAINTLVEYDILPDAVFSYDPGEKNYLVFDKMIKKNKDTIPLVYGSSVGHQLLENYRGPKYHFITSQDYTSRLLLGNQISLDKMVLDSPSIAIMTFQIVNKLEMSPVILAGQNLGYLHNRRYAKGIDYDFINSELTANEVSHADEIKDVFGNTIKTTIGFNSMRQSLEYFAEFFNGEYYNTTKGGALIKNIPFKTIEAVIKEDIKTSIEKESWTSNNISYDLENYDLEKVKLRESYESYVENEKRLKKTLDKIKKETGKKKLEKLFTKVDNELTKFETNDFFGNFIVQAIRVEHDLLIQKINKTAKKNTLEKKNDIINIFDNYLMILGNVTNRITTRLEKEKI